MFPAKLVEDLSRRAGATVGYVLQTLANRLLGIRACCDVQQSLISLGVLHHGGGFSFNRQHYRALTLLSCLMKSPERRRKVVSD